jgi:IclR family mhp operon transcriptional activator
MSDTGLQLTLRRGLRVLEILNNHLILTASDASRLSGFSRPTTYRLLRALEGLGYVTQDPGSKRYSISSNVLRLSRGFRDEQWIQAVARPLMDTLCHSVLWPISVCTHIDGQMMVRYSTDHISPFPSIRNNKPFNISMTGTATGSVFLAYTDPLIRYELVEKDLTSRSAKVSEDRKHILEQRFKRVKRDGYCCLELPQTKQVGMAVPVFVQGTIFSVLSLRFYSSAMTVKTAVERYYTSLRATADKIEGGISVAAPLLGAKSFS